MGHISLVHYNLQSIVAIGVDENYLKDFSLSGVYFFFLFQKNLHEMQYTG